MTRHYWKDVLIPGTYRLLNGKLRTYTRADCEAAVARMKKMRDAGLSVPLCQWHVDDATPVSKENRRRRQKGLDGRILGQISDARVAFDGRAEMLLECDDDASAEELRRLRFVSPELRHDWRDPETGTMWPGLSITHVAATARPVARDQGELRPVQLSLDRGNDVVWLALDRRRTNVAKQDDDDGMGEAGLAELIEALKGIDVQVPDEVTDMKGLIIAIKSSGNWKGPQGEDEDVITEDSAPVMMSRDRMRRKLAGLSASDAEARKMASRDALTAWW